MEVITVLYAHPYPTRSIACKVLVEALRPVEGLHVRTLYDLYPDFDIDVPAEQAALEKSGLVVLLHPVYWYSVPGLLKHYLDVVFVKGWAYGTPDTKLQGKDCLWVATTGGDDEAYSAAGRHEHPFGTFAPPLAQAMRYCGMKWLEPHVVHASHRLDAPALARAADGLRDRIFAWKEGR